jgi:hypothetical protein
MAHDFIERYSPLVGETDRSVIAVPALKQTQPGPKSLRLLRKAA